MGYFEEISRMVLYEDNHIIIVNKRPSDIVQGDKTQDTPLSEMVKEYLRVKYNKPGEAFLGVVHRLDRPVSGIIIFAKTSKALTRLNELIKKREVTKTYWAIVKQSETGIKNYEEGSSVYLTDWLKKNESQNKSYVVSKDSPGASKAELEYRIIGKSKTYLLMEVILHTGRHHQIRVQLANIGYAIKGDLKYGYPRSNEDASICLHARNIKFTHPVSGEKIDLSADPPDNKNWKMFI
jgi:23S rRNA pseudouridine1911/1915/1917 synthase